MADITSWFYKPTEKLVAVIGQGYLASLLQGNMSRTVVALTGERLYQKGKVFERAANGVFQSNTGSKVVEVRTVTGTSYYEINHVFARWIGLLGVVSGIVLFAAAFLEHEVGQSQIYALLGALGLFVGIPFLLIYYLTRRRLFVVEYPGGALATDARWYSPQELDSFQRSLSLAIEEAAGKVR